VSLSEVPTTARPRLPLRWRAEIAMDAGKMETTGVMWVLADLDSLSGPVLTDLLDRLVGPDCKQLTIDVSGASFVSAEMLRMIDERYPETGSGELAVALIGLPPPARRLADVLDLSIARDDDGARADGGRSAETTIGDDPAGHVEVDWSTAGVAAVTISGEFDIANTQELRSTLSRLPKRRGSVVALHLADVSFASSSMLSMMIEFHHLLAMAGGRLVIPDASPRVRRLLRVTGTADMLGLGQDSRAADHA